jgi:hypothetical protein
MATLVVGMGVRGSLAVFGDQETSTATSGTAGCFVDDAAAPTITASIISKTAPSSIGGFVKQAGTYHVYANITGVATRVTADVRQLTAGQSLAPLAAGAYTLGGVAYGWRSASLTVGNPLAAGAYTYSVSAADAALQCRTASWSVTVDNTAPTGTDVQPYNKAGGTSGRPEIADTIVYTFSEVIDPDSVLAGWTGASTNVVARITDNGGNDLVTVWDSANSVQLALGSTDLANNYVTTNTTWGASGTASTMVQSGTTITITLGTQAGTTRQAAQNRTAVWTPSAAATDDAGNATSTTNVNEGGAADHNF